MMHDNFAYEFKLIFYGHQDEIKIYEEHKHLFPSPTRESLSHNNYEADQSVIGSHIFV